MIFCFSTINNVEERLKNILIQDTLSHTSFFGNIHIAPESVSMKRQLLQDASQRFEQLTSDNLNSKESSVLQTKSGVVRKAQTNKTSR